jgi:tRNA(fMet)-specific endonuclease VapC
LLDRFQEEPDRIAISSVVLMELLYGAAVSARPRHHRSEVEDFVDRLMVLDLDSEAAAHAADIKADLRAKGTPIGVHDTLIAGQLVRLCCEDCRASAEKNPSATLAKLQAPATTKN